jgi:uracil-DNA glycosylase
MWETYKRRCMKCKRCQGLLDNAAFPLFMKWPPKSTELLFIWEAPNRDDTCNPDKGYITVDSQTDPSGAFFHDLFVNELRYDVHRDLFVTNSVLCLPANRNENRCVTSAQREHCSGRLRQLIDLFNPFVVCPLGTQALKATALIDDHGFRSMAAAVAKQQSWYGRLLFPLYHTSRQARNPRNGRAEERQRADWRQLRTLLDQIRRG